MINSDGAAKGGAWISFLVNDHLLQSYWREAKRNPATRLQSGNVLYKWIKTVLVDALNQDAGRIDAKKYPELVDPRGTNVKFKVPGVFHDACEAAAALSGCSLSNWIQAHLLKAMDGAGEGQSGR